MKLLSVLALLTSAATLVNADCYTTPPGVGGLWLKGINLSGFDWGTDTSKNILLDIFNKPVPRAVLVYLGHF
jgi:hypothetical protein